MRSNIYRDGRIHVMAGMCSTCIYRPGNLMRLQAGRREQMEADADADDSTIVCHSTLDKVDQSACFGYFQRRSSTPLRLAEAMDLITYTKGNGLCA